MVRLASREYINFYILLYILLRMPFEKDEQRFEIILGRDEVDRKKFGSRGTILVGKHYVKMAQVTALSQPVYMDLNKAHVVFVCGKRGTGKCLAGDTLITLEDGLQVRIDDLADREGQILALNGKYKIVSSDREGFYRRKVNKLFRVVFRSGKEIKLTPEHPLFTLYGWKPCCELTLGTRIATPRVIPAFGNEFLEEDKIKILAYLIAEGHLGNNCVRFSNGDAKIINDFEAAIKGFDGHLEVHQHSKYDFGVVTKLPAKVDIIKRDSAGRIVQSKHYERSSIKIWLEELGLYGKLSQYKFIPDIILQLPKNKISLFLNRLFSCDGCIHKHINQWIVSYCSTSEQLIRQVHHLLLRFGIISKICSKKHAYEIVVYGANVNIFLKEIGFYGMKEIKQSLALNETIEVVRNPNVDTIPHEIWDVYAPSNWAEVGRQMGYKYPKALRESIDYAPSRQKLMQIALLDKNEEVLNLACSDIFWDEIVSMQELQGEFDVFDISVPKLHNFVANDIIVHNSYSLGVIAEGIATLPAEFSQKLSVILFDTMGIYWTMKYPNHKDESLLHEWGFEGKGIDAVKIYTPFGFFKSYKEQGIPADVAFAIKPSELQPDDWNVTFELATNDPIAVFIERVVLNLKKQKSDYDIQDILTTIRADLKEEVRIKNAAENRFLAADSWGVFSKDATPMKDLIQGGQISIIDLSCYATMANAWKIKTLVTGLICKRVFVERMIARKNEEFAAIHSAVHYIVESEKLSELPMVWLMVDEAHEFLPKEGKTGASDALVMLLREGRQPGIAMLLATQQPGKIHTDAMTQSDIILAHRLTAKIDTDALASLLQSYLRAHLDVELDNLPKLAGACIALDDVNERMFPMRVRPRFSWHGGSAPSIVKEERKFEL